MIAVQQQLLTYAVAGRRFEPTSDAWWGPEVMYKHRPIRSLWLNIANGDHERPLRLRLGDLGIMPVGHGFRPVQTFTVAHSTLWPQRCAHNSAHQFIVVAAIDLEGCNRRVQLEYCQLCLEVRETR